VAFFIVFNWLIPRFFGQKETNRPVKKITHSPDFVVNTEVYFWLKATSSNSVPIPLSPPFIHYPDSNHFSPALNIILHYEE